MFIKTYLDNVNWKGTAPDFKQAYEKLDVPTIKNRLETDTLKYVKDQILISLALHKEGSRLLHEKLSSEGIKLISGFADAMVRSINYFLDGLIAPEADSSSRLSVIEARKLIFNDQPMLRRFASHLMCTLTQSAPTFILDYLTNPDNFEAAPVYLPFIDEIHPDSSLEKYGVRCALKQYKIDVVSDQEGANCKLGSCLLKEITGTKSLDIQKSFFDTVIKELDNSNGSKYLGHVLLHELFLGSCQGLF